MFDSPILANPGKRLEDLEARGALMLSGMVYAYQVKSGANGLVTLDYSALKLTKPPRIGFGAQLATVDAIPLFINVVGSPTKDSAQVQVRRITSILSLGLVPQYTGIPDMTVDVYVRPVL